MYSDSEISDRLKGMTVMKKFLKRSLAILLAVLCATNFAVVSFAEDTVKTGKCGENASWSFDTVSGLLVISGDGEMKSESNNNYMPWNKYKEEVKEVVIENGITTICKNAFSGCKNLETVTISNSIMAIDTYAFFHCESLVEITIPDSVVSIGNYAFDNCVSLTTISIGKSVADMKYTSFLRCKSLTDITVDSENLNFSSEDGVLYNKDKTKLIKYPVGNSRTSFEIPEGVEDIEIDAFYDCSYLVNVKIPEGVVNIGFAAFYNCDNITGVTLPKSIKSIAESAFSDCNALKDIYYSGDLTSWCSNDFETFLSQATNYYINGELVSDDLVLPEGITYIGSNVFNHCIGITNVIIPNSVTSVGESAFRDCIWLKKVHIPDNVNSVGEGCFVGCHYLSDVKLPDAIVEIKDFTFSSCDNLKQITIPENVTSIGEYSFQYCNALANITIPEGVIKIEKGAFRYCPNLTTTYYPGTEEQWNAISVGTENEPLTRNVVFNYGKPSNICGENATWTFDEVSGSLIVNGTGEIDANLANWGQIKDQVTYVEVENGITSVGESAFDGFTALQEVYFSESVLTVGADAFSGCEKLAVVTILADNVSLANSAFTNTDSRLFFVVKSGSQTQSALATAGYSATAFRVGSDEKMDNQKTLTFEGKTVLYDSLDYNYISNLIFGIPDLYYVKFEKMVLDGVTSMDGFLFDTEIPEENIEPDEEYLTVKDVYVSVLIDGEKVSFEELIERVSNGDYSGFIFTDYVEDGVNSSFFESVAEFFGQVKEAIQGALEFTTEAFDAIRVTLKKFLEKIKWS